jgi:putative ABC transport system permease protein
MGTDTKKFPRLFPEIQFDPGQLAALQNTRNAVIVGEETARKYGFKAGDRITLQTQTLRKDGSRNWTFDVVGTYENKDAPDTAIQLLANYDYINEALPDGQGKDTMILAMVRIADPKQASTIGNTIDGLFANSTNETLTQSEHELAESQVSRIGDLDLVVHRITGAAFFVLLFSTGALMMQSIRERTPELAVLKTFGFPDILVMTLILIETLLLCVVGAAIGLWIASNILPLARQYIGIGAVPRSVIVTGIVVAIVLGLAGGAIPAWRGLRLRVVDALADR